MFQFMDSLLVLYGARVRLNLKVVKVVNFIFRAFFVIFFSNQLFNSWKRIFEPIRSSTLLVKIAIDVDLIYGLLTQYLLIKRRHFVQTHLDQVFQLSNCSTRSKLFKMEVILFLVNWLIAASSIVSVFYRFIDDNRNLDTIETIEVLARLYIALVAEQWINASAFPYLYLATSIELIKQVGIQHVRLDPLQLIAVVRNCNRMKEKFESRFRMFPFLWYSYLFLGATGTLANRHVTSNATSVIAISFYVVFLSRLIFIFALTWMINEQMSKTQKLIENKMAELINSNKFKWSTLNFVQSQVTKNVTYTAIGLFELNSGIILSFASGLVTFTVMFLQLSSS